MRTYWCDPSFPNLDSNGSAPSTRRTCSETSSENEFEN
jgi:hypothetical protein